MFEGTEFSSRNLLGNVLIVVVLFAFDKLFASKMLPSSRWFTIHAFANLLVCITAIPAVMATISDPVKSMDSRVYNDTTLMGNAGVHPKKGQGYDSNPKTPLHNFQHPGCNSQGNPGGASRVALM